MKKSFLYTSEHLLQVRLQRLLLLLLMSSSAALLQSMEARRVECFCTTADCILRNSTWCSTSVACYTQWLDRKDGSQPFTRGCIMPGHSSSLLCLNHRPSLDQNVLWPYLLCCTSNRCNENVTTISVSTVTSSGKPQRIISSSTTSSTVSYVEKEALSKLGVKSIEELKEKLEKQDEVDRTWSNSIRVEHVIVIGIGVVITIIISGIGFYCVLKYKIIHEMKGNVITSKSKEKEMNAMSGQPLYRKRPSVRIVTVRSSGTAV